MHGTFDPAQYLRFEDLRLRPALELLARAAPREARRLYDVGCGEGRIARILAERWPEAQVVGVDASRAMLDAARAGGGRVAWELADLAAWLPPAGADLVYSNAALHWVEDHLERLPRWVERLAPGGVLALQVPRATDEPSHALIRAVLREERLGPPGLADELERWRVPDPAGYHDALAPTGARIEVWETRYVQELASADAVFEWVRGTTLLPVVAALEQAEWARFERLYRARLAAAYPARANGKVLYPFPRVFAVARRE
jgi:trans-aconitate 2-methyltransferase